jgi:hypothetical protein
MRCSNAFRFILWSSILPIITKSQMPDSPIPNDARFCFSSDPKAGVCVSSSSQCTEYLGEDSAASFDASQICLLVCSLIYDKLINLRVIYVVMTHTLKRTSSGIIVLSMLVCHVDNLGDMVRSGANVA